MRNSAIKLACGLLLAIIWLASLPSTGRAQQEKGDKELQLQGSLTFGLGDAGGSFSAMGGAQLGYFFTDQQEVGVGVQLTFSRTSTDTSVGGVKISGSGISISAFPHGFYRFHLKRGGKFYPYVGVEGGIAISGSPGSTFNFGGQKIETEGGTSTFGYVRPNAGAKYFFQKNAALDVNAGYQVTFVSGARQQEINGRLGLSFIF